VEGVGVAIASIESDTALTLTGAYGGTAGATKTINVAGIDQSTFVSPSAKTHGDVLAFGDISKNEYKGIWIKRIVNAAAAGYTNNQFALKLESA
jgi:phage baseplate assembly protein gpV